MHAVFALLCFVVVIHWLIFPYPSGLLHWHCGNLTIAPVPAKQPWWIWINTSCEFTMNDCITTTKQRTTKPCAYFLGYTVSFTVTSLLLDESYDCVCNSDATLTNIDEYIRKIHKTHNKIKLNKAICICVRTVVMAYWLFDITPAPKLVINYISSNDSGF